MIEEVLGSNGSRFVIAAAAVGIGLLLLVIVLRLMRNRPSSPFLRGGKNRQPRLAVLDAAAVDTRRRLVLVRRDDVEHLIMIGGPTDIVIESRITSDATVGQPVGALSGGSQPVVAASVQQPATSATPAITPAMEKRVARPAPEKREIPQPEQKQASPVSNIGQMLYADDSDPSAVPTQRAQPVRPAPEPVVRTVQPVDHATPVQPPREQYVPVPVAAQPAVETMKSPEDILDAARTRVLPSAVASPVQNATTASEPQRATPADDKATSVAEFERILDAQISGDLGRLSTDDGRMRNEPRLGSPTPLTGVRQEPSLTPVGPDKRTKPTLEEEMNRMWTDISNPRS